MNVPHPYDKDDSLSDAYKLGWNHGHGIACHNVPKLGKRIFSENLGRVVVDKDNVRDIHQDACFEAESNSRQFSPFEFTAHAFNDPSEFTGIDEADCEGVSEELWEAFEAGVSASIFHDLESYTDEDYGIEPEDAEDAEDGETISEFSHDESVLRNL